MKLRIRPILLAAAAFLLAATQVALAADDQRMNVLLIISDDLRCELTCYGSELAKTPQLDALAAAGVRFDQAYCQFPLCNPSRSSMLTGRYPTTTGVIGNRTWYGAHHPDFVSLPKYFRQHGYVTVRAGKIFHGGIDETDAWSIGGQPRRFGEGAPAGAGPTSTRRLNDDASRRQDQRSPGRPEAPQLTKAQRSDRWIVLEGDEERTGDHRVADRTIEYLREHKDETFFVGCGFSKPHSPLAAPRRFFDLWEVDDIPLPPDFQPRPTVPDKFPAGSIRPRNADLFIGRDASPEEAREMIRAYLASSAWMDWNVGRVLTALDELGLRETTIVVFWGDHGYQLGEKGKWSKAGSLWEQGARVPLIIHDPRAAGNGASSPRVVESIDIFPTLVELCGLPPAEGLEGRSLAPLLASPEQPWDHPAYTVWSEDGEHITGAVVQTEKWRYAEFYGRGPGAMLIDPANDPHELNNLAGDPKYRETVSILSPLVQRHVEGHAPPPTSATRGQRFGETPSRRTVRWRAALSQPNAWYASEEAIRIAKNVLLYQHENGGWGKNIDMARVLSDADRQQIVANRERIETIIDNGATHSQIWYLARVHQATGEDRFAAACRRGIEFLLEAQYDSGGWPMIYPLKRGYYSHITFNDDAMIGVMRVLREVSKGQGPFSFAQQGLRQRCGVAIDKGLDVILQCQIEVDGKLTAWCAQHDEHDFRPRKARSYELPSISGKESAEIVRYLMEIENPSEEVRRSVASAVEWFQTARIEGRRVRTIRDSTYPNGRDRVVVDDPSAPPLWARFYEIGTNRPMFVGRDGVIRDTLAEIEHERRMAYAYLTSDAKTLLDDDYPGWIQRVGQ